MGLKSFIFNGGILGLIRGYDSEKEGRPYGFRELNEDIDLVSDCCSKIAGSTKNAIGHVPNSLIDDNSANYR